MTLISMNFLWQIPIFLATSGPSELSLLPISSPQGFLLACTTWIQACSEGQMVSCHREYRTLSDLYYVVLVRAWTDLGICMCTYAECIARRLIFKLGTNVLQDLTHIVSNNVFLCLFLPITCFKFQLIARFLCINQRPTRILVPHKLRKV